MIYREFADTEVGHHVVIIGTGLEGVVVKKDFEHGTACVHVTRNGVVFEKWYDYIEIAII